ncbi:uncharacterized protein PHACADRAFT_197349 [Phanerochaete carnosa HHB-10118-sp]|uniref:Threonine/serine exporter-like N-terminal domain-containing protein n=1 Tax=Phanerochaete carnosa (strain HHB-10118-sp) TaxID=650164 RepID=K5WWT4_PHACS|nr:uncharacterized protein PHACADRAFT_197349 [Phanerochaete carnosa HHB-10118-sp]EKM54917.1 hypothetical protein PHACADRAFT_197349 [Phanerochaete carnosa HHB-10118-sp]
MSRPSTFFARSVSLPRPCQVATKRPKGPTRADSAPTSVRRTAFMRGTKYGETRTIIFAHRTLPTRPRTSPAPPTSVHTELLLVLMRALAERGASFDRLEAVGVTLSCTLNVPVTVVRRPDALTCYVDDRTGRRKSVRVRRARRARGIPASGSANFGAISPLAHVIEASAFAAAVAAVASNGATPEVLLVFAAMAIFGTFHALMRQLGAKILPERVFATSVMVALSWLAHTPFASTALASGIAGYLLLCAALTQTRVNRGAYTTNTLQVGVAAVFGAMYALALSRGLPAYMDLFLFANIWRLSAIAVPMESPAGLVDTWLLI